MELDEAVDAFGAAVAGAVGVEVCEEGFGPLLQGLAEACDFGDGAGRQDLQNSLSAGAACRGGRGVEQGADVLGDLPRDLHLDVGVVGGERRRQAGVLLVGEVLDPGAQDRADPVQRVAGAAAVPEGVLLDAAPHVVHTRGGELDDVERVDHGDGVGQVLADRVLVPVKGVQRRDLHARTESRAAPGEPVAVHRPGPARDEVEEAGVHDAVLVAGQVDHPGQHLRTPHPLVHVVPHMLVDTEHGHPVEPGRVRVEGGQARLDGSPHGVPVNAELARQAGDRGVLAPHLRHRPLDGPGAQQRARPRNGVVLLTESACPAGWFGAEVPALDPHQPHRPTERGDVDQGHVVTVVGVRDHPAHRAPRHIRQRLDPHHQPTLSLPVDDVEHPHPGQAQPRIARRARTNTRAQRSRVRHSRGPSAIGRGKSPPILPGTSTPTPTPTGPPCSTHTQVGRARFERGDAPRLLLTWSPVLSPAA